MEKNFYTKIIYAIFRERFFFLLISIIGFLLIDPMFEGFIKIRILMDIFLTITLVSGIYAVSKRKSIVIVAALLALPLLMSTWSAYLIKSPSISFIGNCSGILFAAFTVSVIISFIFRENEVTLNVICAAIVVYLLSAIMWAYIFTVLESINPGSFDIPQELLIKNIRLVFIYYSFVTITTLGYGDITPLTSKACSLSLIEAVFGQMYIAVLIARLVGIQITQSIDKKSS